MPEAPGKSSSGAGSRYGIPFAVAAVVILLDRLSKELVVRHVELHQSIPVIEGLVNLVHVRNPGAAFSLFADAPDWFRGPFFVGVTLVAVVVLLMLAARLPGEERGLRMAIGGILGGAVGNLIDRLLYGEVVDFIDVYWGSYHWPAFNVADSSITVSVVTVLFHSFGWGGGRERGKPGDDSSG